MLGELLCRSNRPIEQPRPNAWPLWLGEDAAEPERLKAVLRPYPAEDMTCCQVSALEPIELPADQQLTPPVHA